MAAGFLSRTIRTKPGLRACEAYAKEDSSFVKLLKLKKTIDENLKEIFRDTEIMQI